jgi:hypothetical protein
MQFGAIRYVAKGVVTQASCGEDRREISVIECKRSYGKQQWVQLYL